MVLKSQAKILHLPTPGRTAREGASRWQISRDRFRQHIGRLLDWCGIPISVIQNVSFTDSATGQHIEISVRGLTMRITIDDRDYYFDRLTGRYDGAGSGLLP